MLQLGETLRRTRIDRGLALDEVERATRIRSRYLTALEEDDLDRLPDPVYARSFLREYAELLGLESQPLLDEFDTRTRAGEPPPPPRAPAPPSRPQHGTALVLAAAAAALLGFLVWRGGTRHQTVLPTPTAARPSTSVQAAPTKAAPPVRPFRIVLAAARGECWVAARAGSERGPLLYEGVLRTGRSLRFARPVLWLRLGAPWNVDLRVGGQPRTLSSLGRPINILVTKAGVKPG